MRRTRAALEADVEEAVVVGDTVALAVLTLVHALAGRRLRLFARLRVEYGAQRISKRTSIGEEREPITATRA